MSVLRLIRRPLSDADIRHILGSGIKIIKYSELNDYGDLDDLLPEQKDCCIILIEDRPDRGHWVSLSKYDGLYEHFDSYGVKVDSELRWTNMKMRQKLDQVDPVLTQLLKRELDLDGEKYIWNHFRYQDPDASVNTCGSHVCHRLYRLLHDNMSLEQYYDFMSDVKRETGASYDYIVAEFAREKLP